MTTVPPGTRVKGEPRSKRRQNPQARKHSRANPGIWLQAGVPSDRGRSTLYDVLHTEFQSIIDHLWTSCAVHRSTLRGAARSTPPRDAPQESRSNALVADGQRRDPKTAAGVARARKRRRLLEMPHPVGPGIHGQIYRATPELNDAVQSWCRAHYLDYPWMHVDVMRSLLLAERRSDFRLRAFWETTWEHKNFARFRIDETFSWDIRGTPRSVIEPQFIDRLTARVKHWMDEFERAARLDNLESVESRVEREDMVRFVQRHVLRLSPQDIEFLEIQQSVKWIAGGGKQWVEDGNDAAVWLKGVSSKGQRNRISESVKRAGRLLAITPDRLKPGPK
jgi:hypothetical protein